jgi:hypothetical protein
LFITTLSQRNPISLRPVTTAVPFSKQKDIIRFVATEDREALYFKKEVTCLAFTHSECSGDLGLGGGE